ncbi:MAG: hypothetical protein NC548_43235 [Lachnospiraceae bacterium]|nr:hypothetical protein [Lachnospiraceae bacterium]
MRQAQHKASTEAERAGLTRHTEAKSAKREGSRASPWARCSASQPARIAKGTY